MPRSSIGLVAVALARPGGELSRTRSYTLTDHELRLMNILWDHGEATVGDIVARLSRPMLAYTTVLTTMRTLESKGYLRHRKSGRAFLYTPRVQRADAARSLLNALLDRFFEGSPRNLTALLVSDQRLSNKDIDYLQHLIERKGTR